jgi:hypothetical protein
MAGKTGGQGCRDGAVFRERRQDGRIDSRSRNDMHVF